MENVDNLDQLVEWMRSRGVSVYDGQILTPRGERVVHLAIDLSFRRPAQDSFDAPVAPAAKAFSGIDFGPICACGHSIETEHSEAGCLIGCSEELCVSKATAEPEE